MTTLSILMMMSSILFLAQSEDVTQLAPENERQIAATILLLDISGISEPDEEITADFSVRLDWFDPALVSADAPPIRILSLSDASAPQVTVINGRSITKKLNLTAKVTRDGIATYQQRYQGTLGVPMDLRNFPFDEPEFFIEIMIIDPKGRTLVSNKNKSGMLKPPSVAGWEMLEGSIEIDERRSRGGLEAYPTARLNFTGSRDLTFFTWKLLIPLSLIVCMAYSVFWLDPAVLPAQLSLATSSVFTLIAYNFALSTMLPKSSYLTRADVFIVGCTLLVFGALYESVATGVLARKESKKMLARKMDYSARFIFPVLFLGLFSYSFLI
jgi:gamma-aminobutyric acid receptor subunit beta